MLLAKDRKALLKTVGIDTWEEQDEILDHPARIKLVAGGERAGKSFMGAISIISRLDEFVDGDITYRYAFGRVQQEGDVNFVLTREGAVEYPVTFGVLEATPAYTIITNDPGMASADGGDDDAVAKSSLKAPSMSN